MQARLQSGSLQPASCHAHAHAHAHVMYGEATGCQERSVPRDGGEQTAGQRAALASAAASPPAPLPNDDDELVCPVVWLLGGGSARIFSWRGGWKRGGCFGAGPRRPPAPLPMEISDPGDGGGLVPASKISPCYYCYRYYGLCSTGPRQIIRHPCSPYPRTDRLLFRVIPLVVVDGFC